MNYKQFLAMAEARAAEAAPAPAMNHAPAKAPAPVVVAPVTSKPAAVIIPTGERIAPARKPAAPIAVNHYFGKLAPMGEAAAALMYTQAHIIAYVALDTLYQKQKTPRLFELRNDVCKLSKLNGIDARLDSQFAVHTMTRNIRHTYKLVRIKATGKAFRQECRPYTTRELSEYGKAHNAAARYALDIKANLDGEDVIQEAAARFVELYNGGMIQTFSDFAAVARLVFRAVNRYIAKQCRRDKKAAAAPAREEGHDNNELQWAKAPAERKAPASPLEAAAVAKDTKAAVIAAIVKHAHHNADKAQLSRIAELLIAGYAQAEIAELLKINKMSVSRAVATIGKAAAAAAPVVESILAAELPAEAPAAPVAVVAAPAAPAAPVVEWTDNNSYFFPAEAPAPVVVPAAEKPAPVKRELVTVWTVKARISGKLVTVGTFTSYAAAEKAIAAIEARHYMPIVESSTTVKIG